MAHNVYAVLIPKRVAKQIEKVPEPHRRRIVEKIAALRTNPRPVGMKKLTGLEAYRLRVGDYRVVYEVDDPQRFVTIARVMHRSAVYRD